MNLWTFENRPGSWLLVKIRSEIVNQCTFQFAKSRQRLLARELHGPRSRCARGGRHGRGEWCSFIFVDMMVNFVLVIGAYSQFPSVMHSNGWELRSDLRHEVKSHFHFTHYYQNKKQCEWSHDWNALPNILQLQQQIYPKIRPAGGKPWTCRIQNGMKLVSELTREQLLAMKLG